jgi:hypothetical protein
MKCMLSPGGAGRWPPIWQANGLPHPLIRCAKLALTACLVCSAAVDPAFFATRLYPILEAAGCRGCHAEDGVASGTRLHFPEPDAARDRIQAFGLSLAPLVDRADPAKSLLLNKPANRIRHTGGERIKQGSDEEKILTEWVRYLATLSGDAISAASRRMASGAAGSQPDQFVRRLTHSQYNNTVRDLLGDYSRPADRFPSEDYIDGFKNQLRTQGIPPLLVEGYSTAAEKLALNAFRSGDVNHLVPCKPTSATDEKCGDQFVRKFGERAFRRPLTDAEFRRYSGLFAAQAAKTGKFLEGARVTVETMLQSPKFLFHLESGPGGRYRDYDVASRLSYFLWDTMPDAALLASAANGELRTTQGAEKVARRMLDNPQARPALDEFFAEWMRFDKVLGSVKDRRHYPEFTPELAVMMVEETRRLLEYVVWDDRNFMDVFSADYGFLNRELTSLYKFPEPPGEFQLTRFPADTRRAGLLGQASFLAASAGPVETSPTARGIFVREQLLCQHVPSPPPGVNTNLPEPSAEKPLTRRQRLSAHVENATCSGCHRLMDPIGFGLEHFDGLGRWRDKEHIEITDPNSFRAPAKKFDLELDSSGEIAGIPNSEFSDTKRLGSVLAASPVCQECIVRQMFRYTFGRMETPSDQETIHQLFAAFRDSGFHFKDMLMALVRSPEFYEGLQPVGQAVSPVGNSFTASQLGGRRK